MSVYKAAPRLLRSIEAAIAAADKWHPTECPIASLVSKRARREAQVDLGTWDLTGKQAIAFDTLERVRRILGRCIVPWEMEEGRTWQEVKEVLEKTREVMLNPPKIARKKPVHRRAMKGHEVPE